jgi:hypothetical protein
MSKNKQPNELTSELLKLRSKLQTHIEEIAQFAVIEFNPTLTATTLVPKVDLVQIKTIEQKTNNPEDLQGTICKLENNTEVNLHQLSTDSLLYILLFFEKQKGTGELKNEHNKEKLLIEIQHKLKNKPNKKKLFVNFPVVVDELTFTGLYIDENYETENQTTLFGITKENSEHINLNTLNASTLMILARNT